MIPYVQQISTRHGQTRWVVKVDVGGVPRRQEFAHPLAADDAVVLAGQHRDLRVPPAVTLAKLRLLAYETLELDRELSLRELKRLRILNRRAVTRAALRR